MAEQVYMKEAVEKLCEYLPIDYCILSREPNRDAFLVHFYETGDSKWRWARMSGPSMRSFRNSETLQAFIHTWWNCVREYAPESHYLDGLRRMGYWYEEQISKAGKTDRAEEFFNCYFLDLGRAFPKSGERLSAFHQARMPYAWAEAWRQLCCEPEPEPIQLSALPSGFQETYNGERERIQKMSGASSVARGDVPSSACLDPWRMRSDDHAAHIVAANEEMQRLAGYDAYVAIEPAHIPTCHCGAHITGETHADYCPCSGG